MVFQQIDSDAARNQHRKPSAQDFGEIGLVSESAPEITLLFAVRTAQSYPNPDNGNDDQCDFLSLVHNNTVLI